MPKNEKTRGALRWSEARVEPDLPVPEGIGEASIGYDFNLYKLISSYTPDAAARDAVYPAWSGPVSHGTGHDSSRFGSRGARTLYSTRRLALQALRCAAEQDFARRLASIDRLIAEEDDDAR